MHPARSWGGAFKLSVRLPYNSTPAVAPMLALTNGSTGTQTYGIYEDSEQDDPQDGVLYGPTNTNYDYYNN